jgi:hypothetical protein
VGLHQYGVPFCLAYISASKRSVLLCYVHILVKQYKTKRSPEGKMKPNMSLMSGHARIAFARGRMMASTSRKVEKTWC